MLKKFLMIAVVVLFSTGQSFGEIVLTTSQPGYTQNFNTFLGTVGTVPSDWVVDLGGGSFRGTNNGSTNAGGVYAYGTTGGNEWALGALRTNSVSPIFSVDFRNGTGSVLTAINLSFDYEQWRFANSSGLDLTATGALLGNVTVNNADFTGASTGSGTTTSTVSLSLTGLAIANNATFGFSWETVDFASFDNGLAIDNFSITAVPEPSSIALVSFMGFTGLVAAYRRRKPKSKVA